MLDGLDGYCAAGGRPGGPGRQRLLRVTTATDGRTIPDRGAGAGRRRTRCGNSAPVEWHQAMTAERGRAVAEKGRPSRQSLAGVGSPRGFECRCHRIVTGPGPETGQLILEGIDTARRWAMVATVLGRCGVRSTGRPGAGHAGAPVVGTRQVQSTPYQGEGRTDNGGLGPGGPDSALVRSESCSSRKSDGGRCIGGLIAWCGALTWRGGDDRGRMTGTPAIRFLDDATSPPRSGPDEDRFS